MVAAADDGDDDGERAELRQRMKPVRQRFSVVTINRQNRIDQRGKREGKSCGGGGGGGGGGRHRS